MKSFRFPVTYEGSVVIPARNGAEARELACALVLLNSDDPAIAIGGCWSDGKSLKVPAEDAAWNAVDRSRFGNRSLYRVPLSFEGEIEVTASDEVAARALMAKGVTAVCGWRENPDHCIEPFEDRNVPEKCMDLYEDLPVLCINHNFA